MGQIVVNVQRSANAPDTGALTYIPQSTTGSGSSSYYFGLSIVFAVFLVLIVPVIAIKRKSIKYSTGKFSLFTRKKLLPKLLLLALFSCGITFSTLSVVRTSTNESQAAGQTAFGDTLTGASGDITINVEVGSSPVFVYVPSTVTIEEATEGGYDLSAYVLDTDLVSSDGDKISGLPSGEASSLSENTWGVSLSTPASETSETWLPVSKDENDPTLLKETTAVTPANDKVTIYYGVYISPNLPEGTYTGTINYDTTANLVMQNVAEWSDTVAQGQEVFAVDKRDGRKYSVARLKDGKLWMGENLDLGRTELTTDLTSENTNLKETVTAETFNSWKKTEGTRTLDAGEFISIDGKDEISKTSYGTLYNFFAASAGTIAGASNTNDAMYDICPSGWRLPTGGNSGEFQTLYDQYGSANLMIAPIANGGAAFDRGGGFGNSTPYDAGVYGSYWASTRLDYDRTRSNVIYNSESLILPFSGTDRYYGVNMRCINKQPSRNLTISYDIGIVGITINGVKLENRATIQLEEGVTYRINVTLSEDYTFTNWSATSGTVTSATTKSTTFTMGDSDTTLTATATFTGTYIQNLDAADCTTTASKVYDSRDMHTYMIQRLKDGNCWMMENLNLGRTELTTDLTSENTNLADTITAATFNSWKKTAAVNTEDEGVFISLDGTDETSQTPYGTIYNYFAASAGTVYGDTNSHNAEYDICPAGWRLPTGGSSGEFQALYAQYNSYALMRAPIPENGAAFALSGNSLGGKGTVGRYWSSSTMGDNMYVLVIFASPAEVFPVTASSSRNNAYPLRCVLNAPLTISDLTYMQDFNELSTRDRASVLDSMEDSTVYTLIDNRDNKTYQIAKLKDGNVWMAENLDLGRTELTTNLTSANTNLATTVTATTFNSWKKTVGTQTYDAGEFISVDGTDEISQTPYGTLYNFYAASAGTISGETNNSNAEYDICPAGWRLPTGDTSGEFQALYQQYNSAALLRAQVSDGGAAFALAGTFGNNTPTPGGAGGYWSSTNMYGTHRYMIRATSDDVNPSVGYGRRNGISVRCLIK